MSYKYTQTITVWRKSDESDLYGNESWTRFTVKCRLQQGGKLVTGEFGQSTAAKFVAYTETDLLRNDDWIVEGVYTTAEPVAGAHPIKAKRVAINLRGSRREYRYMA